jgi:hypothetical protein
VFTTSAELRELAGRINRAGSYSMRRFGQLAAQIKRDLAAPVDWSATYSGCDMGIYLYAFSYPRGRRHRERHRGEKARAHHFRYDHGDFPRVAHPSTLALPIGCCHFDHPGNGAMGSIADIDGREPSSRQNGQSR